MNHGVPWKKACPREGRQPAAEVDGFRAWKRKDRVWPPRLEVGGLIAESDRVEKALAKSIK